MLDLSKRIGTGQEAASSDERRKNINQTKGLIKDHFVPNDKSPRSFIGNTIPDVDISIRRSEIELSNYELKQGFLTLSETRKIDENIFEKIINTIAAVVNNGPDSSGKIIIGVADKESDAIRIENLDKIKSIKLGNRFVVGVAREAKFLGMSMEDYVALLKNKIKSSNLTESISMNVLSSIDYNNYYGLGVIVIEIQPQKEMAFVGDNVFWRNFDSTELTTDPRKIATIAKRF